MKKTLNFQDIDNQFGMVLSSTVNSLRMSRNAGEVDVLSKQVIKEMAALTKALKKHINECTLQCIEDCTKMQQMMLDKFNFRPEEYELSFVENRQTVRWTVKTPYNENYFFVSRRGEPVNMDTWFDWIMSMLVD